VFKQLQKNQVSTDLMACRNAAVLSPEHAMETRPGRCSQKTMERSTHFIVGYINYFDWAIFDSYVKLPEGISRIKLKFHSKTIQLTMS
jgi:hypothetical protein